jgi:hypothetical protein
LDLVTTNQAAKTVSVLVNKGNGSFRARRVYRTTRLPRSAGISDLNGDRKPDLVVLNPNANAVSVLLNTSRCCQAAAR